jgi:hypothetical protein
MRARATVHISQEGGAFIGTCPELAITMAASTLDDLVKNCEAMFRSHFIVARDLGVFGREAAKLGLPSDVAVPDELDVAIQFVFGERHVDVDLRAA